MSPHRIMCVEDEAVVAWALQMDLEDLGYEVMGCFARGDEAVRKAAETPPHVILMDIVLEGDLDGIEAARIIRARQNIPVIFLTAYGDEDTLRRALTVTPCTFLIKPVQQRELRAAIEVALRTSQLEQDLQRSEANYRDERNRFEAILNATNDSAYLLDREGAFLAVNEPTARRLNMPRDEIVGKTAWEIFPSDLALSGKARFDQVLKKGRPVRFEDEAEGSIFDNSFVPITDRAGNVQGVAGFSIDITQRRMLEQEFDRLARFPAKRSAPDDAKVSAETVQTGLGWADIIPVVPIPAALILFCILARLDIRTIFEPTWLLPTLNMVFLALLPLAVICIAAKGYLKKGLITLLMLAAGALTLALGSSLAGWALSWLGGGPNVNVTIFNLSALLCAMFHLSGAVLVLAGSRVREDIRRKKLTVTVVFAGITVLISLLTIATMRGLMPVFFLQGQGPTDIRQGVLGAATVIFVVSGSLLAVQYHISRSKFLYWYSLALFLVGTGLVCALFQHAVGSAIGWLGRSALYVAGVYLLMAVFVSSRELHSRGECLETGISELLRHRLELMVEARTSQLSRVIERLSREIDERKQVEEALRQSEQTLRTLVESNPESLFLVDTEGIVLAANKEVARRLSTTLPQLIGSSIYDFFPQDVDEQRKKRMHEAALTGSPVRFEDVRFGRIIDNRIQPVLDQEGNVASLAYLGIDITNLRKAEEVQRRLATAIEQSAESVLITDIEGVIQYANPATEHITGFQVSEIVGQTPRIFKSGEHDKAFYEQLWNTIKAGNVWSGRFINKKKDGTLYYEDATISPVRSASGKIVNFVAVKRDVTEHLELSRQLVQAQKMESIGTLAGGVAHDFNNMLQVVLGYSELVLTEMDEQTPSYRDLQSVYGAALRGADLVKRLLTFSRKVDIEPCPLDLNLQIEQLEKMMIRVIPKMIHIELRLADNLSRVYADPIEMDQVLMNLAVNARDAMPEGGNLIIETANVVPDEDYAQRHVGVAPGEYVLLSVSDTGHGMNKETLDHIFEPFYSTKEVGKGTGLGLSVVYGVVAQHGGRINCYSEPGHGTTFKIYLPALVEEGEQLETTVREAIPKGGAETILLVDDEEFARDLGKRILEGSGYKVRTAVNGKEALKLYSEERKEISLVILDLIMPEMGGKQCLEELLKIGPKVRVLIASGFAANGATKEAIETGARGFVSKPYKIKEILQSVREVLDSE